MEMDGPEEIDGNTLNISRIRTPKSKLPQHNQHNQHNHSISRGSPRRFTPRTPSASHRSLSSRRSPSAHRIRPSASVPSLRPAGTKRLRAQRSRLDLLDNKNLTSFPSPPSRKASGRTPEAPDIVENYFPVKHEAEDSDWEQQLRKLQLDQINQEKQSWSGYMWKKLRWRWRLDGLVR